MRRHVSSYRVQIYDLNAFGELPAAILLRFLQQAASDASAAAGFDVDWYDQHGTLWLIRRTVVDYPTPLRYRDELAVHTWVSDMRRVRSRREYEVRRVADEALVARGWSDWVYVDTRHGKPVRVPHELQRGLLPDGAVGQPRPAQRPVEPPSAAFRTSRRVEFAAIDSVAHVNNAYYTIYLEQDLWDALAAHGWRADTLARRDRLRLQCLDIEYLESARYGDQVTTMTWVTDVGPAAIGCAYVLHRDGRPLLHARSEWQWCGDGLAVPLQHAAMVLRGGAR